MIKRTLKDILKMSNGLRLDERYYDLEIQGVCIDSRTIKNKQLFIPIVGENFNGHDFITMAIEKGATASLWNENEPVPNVDFPLIFVKDTTKALQELAKSYRNQLNLKVVGITGSNGKTSTKDILASLLKTQYKTHKTIGNFNNYIGMPLTILGMAEDTEFAVLEMGMDNFGQIELLTSIATPNAAIITNIGEAHLEGLLTRENIAKAKLEILKGLRPDDLFVYYGDDSILKKEIQNISLDYNVKTYGTGENNDYQPEVVVLNQQGDTFYLREPLSQEYFLPMLGEHQVLNATAAIAVAKHFGISDENIKKGLLQVEKSGSRAELIHGKDFTILDDSYKANPSAVVAALDTFYLMKGYDQKIAILGDMLGMGDEQADMHREIGSNMNTNEIDYLFAYGEFGQCFAETAKDRFEEGRVFTFFDKPTLVEKVKEVMKPNALILVKASRSLQMEDIINALLKD